MSMRQVKKLVATVGKYTDRNGQEKNRYITCGKVFERDDGSRCHKIDSLPVGEWNGWLNEYDLDEDRQQQAPQQTAQPGQAAGQFEADVPFAPLEKNWTI